MIRSLFEDITATQDKFTPAYQSVFTPRSCQERSAGDIALHQTIVEVITGTLRHEKLPRHLTRRVEVSALSGVIAGAAFCQRGDAFYGVSIKLLLH